MAAYATQPAADWLRKAPLHSLISCNHIEPHVRGQRAKNILYSQKYPDRERTLFKVAGHIQGFIFRTICSYEHLRHVLYLIHCPTIHQTTVFLFQHLSLITHLRLQWNVFMWKKPAWNLIAVWIGIVPALSGNQLTVSTRDHNEPDSHSAEGEAAIAEAPDITDWPGSFFSTENVGGRNSLRPPESNSN